MGHPFSLAEQRLSPSRWYALPIVAAHAGMSPITLRRRLNRAAKRTSDSVIAQVDGLSARKAGSLWMIRLGPWA